MDDSINEIVLDKKNVLTMKLLHYFITVKNYNPILLQGVEDEIWLENMDEDYEIIRIVGSNILNEEQLGFDIFKTKRIVKKIKKKTLSFKLKTLSIFLDLHEDDYEDPKDITMVKIDDESDLAKNSVIKEEFPDLPRKVKQEDKKEGLELFTKLTNDISRHNARDNNMINDVFSRKTPIITYILIAICVVMYIGPLIFGMQNEFVDKFAIYRPYIMRGEYYRLLTGTFLHGNILHLLFNCYALYLIGSQMESYLGKIKYLIVYLFSAVTGSLMSIIFLGNGVSVGASGAIFGLMGSMIYFGYHYRVYLEEVLKTEIIPLVVVNLIIGFISTGIDNFAHIGGLIGGFIITIAVGVKYKETTFEKFNGWIMSIIYVVFLLYMNLH